MIKTSKCSNMLQKKDPQSTSHTLSTIPNPYPMQQSKETKETSRLSHAYPDYKSLLNISNKNHSFHSQKSL